jgi:hypothetical protein
VAAKQYMTLFGATAGDHWDPYREAALQHNRAVLKGQVGILLALLVNEPVVASTARRSSRTALISL